jgi:hypothetical protein
MAKTVINDLDEDADLDKEAMNKTRGGLYPLDQRLYRNFTGLTPKTKDSEEYEALTDAKIDLKLDLFNQQQK